MQAKPHLCAKKFVLQLIRYEEDDIQMSKAKKGGFGAGKAAWRGCVCLTRGSASASLQELCPRSHGAPAQGAT